MPSPGVREAEGIFECPVIVDFSVLSRGILRVESIEGSCDFSDRKVLDGCTMVTVIR
jgi:hypothetical protein